ncbi:MAG: shikimate kinase [bacterium]
MNIVFIGGRGTGKSTVSQAVATHFNRKCWVADDLITYEKSGQSIPEMVKEKGWHHFRDVEYQVINKLSGFNNIVIDSGGGAVTDLNEEGKQIFSERKVTALKKNSYVIWLQTPIAIACQRIGEDPNRPSLTGKSPLEEMQEIITLRSPWYEKAANTTFDTSVTSIQQIIETLIPIISK